MIRNTVRALPTMFKVGISEAVAYRAEFLVWILATTMPLIMLALWTTVAREAPVGRFGEKDFVLYFLAMFIVRQLTGSWAVWEINFEIKNGTLSMRLLRPVQPLAIYAVENLAALPMRLVVALPVAAVALFVVGAQKLPREPAIWGLWAVAMLGGWLITLLANLLIGCLAFFMESSTKIMDVWLAAFFVFSGYLVPVELFPKGLQAVVNWLPFRYQVGLPVELMTGGWTAAGALPFLGRQWLFVALLLALTAFAWKQGVRRYGAYGG